MEQVSLTAIAHIHTPFPEKFGIPRQSGLAPALTATIVFEEPYRVREAFRGLSNYSHLWLIWQFFGAEGKNWSPTVRPPRLGGNRRMGVFATRSPNRPNPLGLSSVKLERVAFTRELGPVLTVSGADLMDGTPIFDIKPYLPFTDSHADARGGFASEVLPDNLTVQFSPQAEAVLDADRLQTLEQILRQDPRPSYQEDPGRVYGFCFDDMEVRFSVNAGTLQVLRIEKH